MHHPEYGCCRSHETNERDGETCRSQREGNLRLFLGKIATGQTVAANLSPNFIWHYHRTCNRKEVADRHSVTGGSALKWSGKWNGSTASSSQRQLSSLSPLQAETQQGSAQLHLMK